MKCNKIHHQMPNAKQQEKVPSEEEGMEGGSRDRGREGRLQRYGRGRVILEEGLLRQAQVWRGAGWGGRDCL